VSKPLDWLLCSCPATGATGIPNVIRMESAAYGTNVEVHVDESVELT
jgi:hypothetical protein